MKIKKAILSISDAKAWASHPGTVFSSHYELEKLMILGPHKPTYKIGLLLWSQIVKGPETVMRKHNLRKAATYVCLVSFFVFVLQYLLSTLSSGPVKVHVI